MKEKSGKIFTYQSRPVFSEDQKQALDAFGSLYGRMERQLFRDLIAKKQDRNARKSSYLTQFGVTARQYNGCLCLVQGKIRSIKELRLQHIKNLKETIADLCKKIPKIKNLEIRHQKKRRLHHLTLRLEKLQQEVKEEKVSLCFGSKKLFSSQHSLEENGFSSKEEWKKAWTDARSSEFFCIGSKDELSGNQSCVLKSEGNGQFFIKLRLPNSLIQEHGKYVLIPIPFSYGAKQIEEALASKQALSYRFKKDEKGWRVFVSFEHPQPALITKKGIGAIGIDININHIALTEVDSKGNPIHKKTIPLCSYGKNKKQAQALIGDAVKEIINFAKGKQKPIIREDLDFAKKKASLRENTPKQARMLSSFHYSEFIQNLESKAFREGIDVSSVNPAMTSIIGKIKFSKRYGLSVHHGAALVIARRHYQFSEIPSKCPMRVVHKQFHVTCPAPERKSGQHVWTLWRKVNVKLKTALAAHLRKSPGS